MKQVGKRVAKRLAGIGTLLLFVAGISLASWMAPHLVLRESPMRGKIQDGWQAMIGGLRPSPPVMGDRPLPQPNLPAAPVSSAPAETEGA